jgi:hypothetical protein
MIGLDISQQRKSCARGWSQRCRRAASRLARPAAGRSVRTPLAGAAGPAADELDAHRRRSDMDARVDDPEEDDATRIQRPRFAQSAR